LMTSLSGIRTVVIFIKFPANKPRIAKHLVPTCWIDSLFAFNN
jgi:hypothetical protein